MLFAENGSRYLSYALHFSPLLVLLLPLLFEYVDTDVISTPSLLRVTGHARPVVTLKAPNRRPTHEETPHVGRGEGARAFGF